MTKLPVFECDGCGERHGHKTEMTEVEIRYESEPHEHPREETMHACIDCAPLPLQRHAKTHVFYAERADGDPLRWYINAVLIDKPEGRGKEKVTREDIGERPGTKSLHAAMDTAAELANHGGDNE